MAKAIISGADFKRYFPGPYPQWLSRDFAENGLKPGLNEFPRKVDAEGLVCEGGFSLLKWIKFLPTTYHLGPVLGVFTIPDDSEVCVIDDKTFSCDKIIAEKLVVAESKLRSSFEACFKHEGDKFLDPQTALRHRHYELFLWFVDKGCHVDGRAFTRFAAEHRLYYLLNQMERRGMQIDYGCRDWGYEGGRAGSEEIVYSLRDYARLSGARSSLG